MTLFVEAAMRGSTVSCTYILSMNREWQGWRKCWDCVLSGMSSHTGGVRGDFHVFHQWELGDSGSWLETFWFQVDVMQVEELAALLYYETATASPRSCSGSVEECTFVGFLVRFRI